MQSIHVWKLLFLFLLFIIICTVFFLPFLFFCHDRLPGHGQDLGSRDGCPRDRVSCHTGTPALETGVDVDPEIENTWAFFYSFQTQKLGSKKLAAYAYRLQLAETVKSHSYYHHIVHKKCLLKLVN